MSKRAIAPGWVARCPKCPYEVDLESLGWTRKHAYSWGKRRMMRCPKCERRRAMRIIHVDEKGNPDQPLGLVLRKVLALQAAIWMALLSVGAVVVTILIVVGILAAPW